MDVFVYISLSFSQYFPLNSKYFRNLCIKGHFPAKKKRGTVHLLYFLFPRQYRRCATTLSVGGLRQQFSMAENVEMSLFGADFLRQAERLLHVEGVDMPHINFQVRKIWKEKFISPVLFREKCGFEFATMCSNMELYGNLEKKTHLLFLMVESVCFNKFMCISRNSFVQYVRLYIFLSQDQEK